MEKKTITNLIGLAVIVLAAQQIHYAHEGARTTELYELCLSQTSGNAASKKHCRFRALAIAGGATP